MAKKYHFVMVKFGVTDDKYNEILQQNVSEYLEQGWDIVSVTAISRLSTGNIVFEGGSTNAFLVVLSKSE